MPAGDALSAIRQFRLNTRQVSFAFKNGDNYSEVPRVQVACGKGKEFVPLTKRKRLAQGSLWYFDEMYVHFVHTQTHRLAHTYVL